MTELRRILESQNIRRAVVIDDVFDEAPRPDELNHESWSIFFDDLKDDGQKYLGEIFPDYEATAREELEASAEFIESLWAERKSFPGSDVDTLFKDYESANTNERSTLEDLIKALEGLGLESISMGRKIGPEAERADIIFIDLFLGYQQTEDDIQSAIGRVRSLVGNRADNPPLVVLMSRSPRLQDKRDEFRDAAGLLGTIFRVVSKSELAKEGTVESILLRLASHYPDAKRVAGFVYAWEEGLNRARDRFIRLMRRLDLPDLAQIHALLLEPEGEKLGDYLLDVADRVLQHEIERDEKTISASIELNKIDVTKYPAPHLQGSPDLQDLVHRMIFLNQGRLALSEENGVPVLRFGDVLRLREEGGEFGPRVFLVLTPACDLIRRRAECVLLLSGTLEQLLPGGWTYSGGGSRTPIIIHPDGSRYLVNWNLKSVQSLSWEEIDAGLENGGKLSRLARLRELYALELQQRLLSDLGRVGQIAQMPACFEVSVLAFYVDTNGLAKALVSQELKSAIYVGRDAKSKSVHRLVLSEQGCDEIRRAVRELDVSLVHQSARTAFDGIKADPGFFVKFERGDIELQINLKDTQVRCENNVVRAAIIRAEDFVEGGSAENERRRAALLLKLIDVSSRSEEGVD